MFSDKDRRLQKLLKLRIGKIVSLISTNQTVCATQTVRFMNPKRSLDCGLDINIKLMSVVADLRAYNYAKFSIEPY